MSGWSDRDLAFIGAADEIIVAPDRVDHGRIRSDGKEFRVRFAEVAGPGLRGQIDEAYRVKYGRYGSSYVAAMTSDSAAETTPQLEPAG